MNIAGPPPPDTPLPESLREIVGDADARPVWRNELGGLTFEMAGRFIKWAPKNSALDLEAEAVRLRWAGKYTPVPEVLDAGPDWLLTRALPGESAVSPRWLADPATAVAAIGRGLRALHDALPVADCPFDWSAEARGATDQPPPIDRLVVCHADACAPNTLVGDDGEWTGHVDLGRLGVADRWADIAVATWSTQWNYGPGWEQRLLDAYGIDDDPERTAYYRRLWDMT